MTRWMARITRMTPAARMVRWTVWTVMTAAMVWTAVSAWWHFYPPFIYSFFLIWCFKNLINCYLTHTGIIIFCTALCSQDRNYDRIRHDRFVKFNPASVAFSQIFGSISFISKPFEISLGWTSVTKINIYPCQLSVLHAVRHASVVTASKTVIFLFMFVLLYLFNCNCLFIRCISVCQNDFRSIA